MNGRLIIGALALQLIFGWLVFRSAGGRDVFLRVNDGVNTVMAAAMAGPRFVLGKLAEGEALHKAGLGPFILLTQGLPTIIVFSSLIAVLYYLGIMSALLRGFAWLFSRTLRVSGAESLCAAANIFVGIESTMAVRPYLSAMTRSELCAVLAAGMATVASNVLALYVGALQEVFPNIAGHMVSASFLSAPAAILMAKIICPETDSPLTLGLNVPPAYEQEGGVFEAIINGAEAGLKMMLGIAALLVAIVGLLAICDAALIAAGGVLNEWTGWRMDWRLTSLLAYPFYPLAVLMGVPASTAPTAAAGTPDEAWLVARLLAQRLIATEVPSYFDLAEMLRQAGPAISPRTAVIAAYALCGFAHLPSLAIFAGGVAALVPERKRDLALVGWRSLAAATLACLMTGCIAGVFAADTPAVLGVGHSR